MKRIFTTIAFIFCISATNLFAQGTLNGSQKEGLMQLFKAKLSQLKQTYNDNAQFTTAFRSYYSTILIADRKVYNSLVMQNKLTATQAKAYMSKLSMKYDSMHAQFATLTVSQPNVLTQYNKKNQTKQTITTCNPTDTNLNFTNGYLSGWYAYYAENTSRAVSYLIIDQAGGLCGNVTETCNDNITSQNSGKPDYQIAIRNTQTDPLVPSIPVVAPGAKYSVRIGDSTNAYNGVAQIMQSFLVTPANENFNYQYSLFLENPSPLGTAHGIYEKPFYTFQVYDSLGGLVTCYNLTYTAIDLKTQGYDSVYYKPNADYVYYTGWQSAQVSLKQFEGHCVTISFTVSDCSLGAHFGYGYFSFEKNSQGIQASPYLICGANPVTLTAPGGYSHTWTGPAGSITKADTTNSLIVSTPGKYSVIIAYAKGSLCMTDTLYYTLDSGIAKANITSTPYYCSAAGATATATAVGTAPYTYSWSNSQTTSVINNLTPGTYNVYATDSKGCVSVDTFSIDSTSLNINFNLSASVVEPGDSIMISASTTSQYPSNNYVWAPAALVRYPDSASTYVYPKTTTIYTVTAQWVCGNLSDTVTVRSGCNLKADYITRSGCSGTAPYVIVTASSSNGVAPYTYKWSNGLTSNTDSLYTSGTATYSVVIADSNGCKASTSGTLIVPSAFEVFYSASPITCVDSCNATLTAVPQGGFAPYTYLWSTSSTSRIITKLCPGNYNIAVTDSAGCHSSLSTSVSAPVPLAITFSVTPNECPASAVGTICADVTGGQQPYDYSWGSGYGAPACLNFLPSKIMNFTVGDYNGCLDTASVFIPNSPLQAIPYATPDTLCTGDSTVFGVKIITPRVAGSYNFLWNPGNITSAYPTMKPTTTTTYTLSLSDQFGCNAAATVTVYTGLPLTLSVTASPDTIIAGNTTSLSAIAGGGGGSYTYLWSPVTGLNSSTTQNVTATLSNSEEYYTTLTDKCGARTNGSIYVLVDTNFAGLYIDSLLNGGCNNSLWVASASGANLSQFSFVWSNGATTDTISGLCAGTYSVTITDNDPIIPTRKATIVLHIHIINTTGINEIQNNSTFSLYPVPATSNLNISLSSSIFQPTYLSVYDITGRQVAKQNISFKHTIETIDVSSLANGTYMLMLSDGKTNSQAKFTVIH